MPAQKVTKQSVKKSQLKGGSTGSSSSRGFIKLPSRFNKIGMIIFVALFAGVGSYLLFFSKAATTPQAGIYTGPADVSGHNSFATWLGSPINYVTDYVDYKNGWAIDFSPNWLTDAWSSWVKAVPGRQLVLGLPMLENSDTGQFDQCSSGAFDQHFITLATNMVNHGLGNSIIRLGYEMNNPSIGPWQATNNPIGFKNCFHHLVGVMRNVPSTSFQFDLTFNADAPGSSPYIKFDDYYPGDDVVDIIGTDQYDIKWQDTTLTPEQRWNFFLTRPMGLNEHKAFAMTHNKPISFPEWGLYAKGDQFGGGGDSPYYIDRMADWFANNNAYYQSYFNINWGGGVLADFPMGQAEYKSRFGSNSDITPPIVSIVSPVVGTTIGNSVIVNSTASDNAKITKLEIYIDSSRKASNTNLESISYTWNSRKAARGSHTITVKAYDAAGNVGTSSVGVSK